MVEFVAALATRHDELSVDEEVDVLGNGLTRRCEAMPCRKPRANLEQGLVVSLIQLLQDRASSGVRQSLEDVSHGVFTIRKYSLACQVGACSGSDGFSSPGVTLQPGPDM